MCHILQYQYDVQKCNVVLQHLDLHCGQRSTSDIWWFVQSVLCMLYCGLVSGMYGPTCYGVYCKGPQNTWVGPYTPQYQDVIDLFHAVTEFPHANVLVAKATNQQISAA